MARIKVVKGLGLAVLAFTLSAGMAIAQPPDKKGDKKGERKPVEDISTKVRNVKPELKEAY